jgi:polysaccharide pyruvyl transferase WcaK-like protein
MVRILIGEDSDTRAVADLTREIINVRKGRPAGQLLMENASSLHDLMVQILETDIVVATRFHNVVCALKLGRPTVSLGYANKNDALLAEFGLAEFCHHVETFDVNLLQQQVSKLLAERNLYVDRIRQANLAIIERLRCQDEILEAKVIPIAG